MAEQFSDNEAYSSIRAKNNRNVSELATNSQTIVTLSNQVSSLITRVTTLEANEGGTPDPVTTSDGTLTYHPFTYVDIFNYAYQTTGTRGQQFSKDNSTTGYKGAGYAKVNSISAVDGTSATAYIDGFATDATDPDVQVDRKVWIRVRGAIGATIAGKSHNGGTIGTVTLNQSQTWHWLQMSTNHKAYDNQYRLFGRSANVLIDGFILTALGSSDTPAGKDGFRNS